MTPVPSATLDNPWLSQQAIIREMIPEISGVTTYRLQLADNSRNDSFRFRAGQFNMLYLPGAGEVAISISGAREGCWEHAVRVAGNVTQSLARLRPGATLGLRGPYGSHWPIEQCRGNDLVIVAGGIGLPPLRPAIDELLLHRADYGRIVLLYGARTADLLMYAGEHARWTAGGVEIHTTVDRATAGWKGNVGVVPLLVDRLAGLVPERARVFLCGPEVMMRYSVRSALQRGLAMSRIWLSLERNMQCAVALCGHCQMGPMFLCKDGPVFRYDRVEPYLRVEGL